MSLKEYQGQVYAWQQMFPKTAKTVPPASWFARLVAWLS